MPTAPSRTSKHLAGSAHNFCVERYDENRPACIVARMFTCELRHDSVHVGAGLLDSNAVL